MLNLDVEAIFTGKLRYADAIRDITYQDLSRYTDEMYNEIATIIADLTDEAVVFVPSDPSSQEEDERGWTLGHVIVHLTASSEEAAAAAAMMARGIELGQRLRYEIPWETITTAKQVHERLQESQRMCRALLDAWPDAPHLEIASTVIPQLGPINAIGRYVMGLIHGNMHPGQLREIMRQVAS